MAENMDDDSHEISGQNLNSNPESSQSEEKSEKIYEMLWNCEYCGTKGLLGKTHRYCPACGAKQNPDKRYFPDENSKVEVLNDNYIGADKVCPACNTAASAASTHCPGCGSPLEKASNVKLHTQTEKTGGPKVTAGNEGEKKSKAGLFVTLGIVAAVVIFAALALIKKDIQVTASRHIWETSVEIEQFKEFTKEDNCSSVPSNAINVVDYGKRKENCRKEKTDRGDGTFSETEVCDEVHRCQFTVQEWTKYKTQKKTGGLNDAVKYPTVYITGGVCVGCTREGSRDLVYKIYFKNAAENKEYTCSYKDASMWQSVKDNASYKTKVNLMGSLSCNDLTPE